MPMRARQIWFLRALRMLECERRQFLLMRAPTHLGRRGSLFAEALDAPGVDELVDLLGPVGDLRVPFAAVNHFDAKQLGEMVELASRGDDVRPVSAWAPATFRSASARSAISRSACLVKWLIRPGLAPCSSTAVGPGSFQAAVIRRSFM